MSTYGQNQTKVSSSHNVLSLRQAAQLIESAGFPMASTIQQTSQPMLTQPQKDKELEKYLTVNVPPPGGSSQTIETPVKSRNKTLASMVTPPTQHSNSVLTAPNRQQTPVRVDQSHQQ